MNIFLRLIS